MADHVLIADDDRPSLNGLEVLLTRWGCRVETATDGQWPWRKPSPSIRHSSLPISRCPVLAKRLSRDPRDHSHRAGGGGPLLPAPEEGPYGYLEKPVEVPQLRMLVATALAPEPGTVSSRASRGLRRPKPPTGQTPLPERAMRRIA